MVAGGDLAVGGGIERQAERKSSYLSGNFRHPIASLSADLVHTVGPNPGATQYGIGVQTIVAAGAGSLYPVAKSASEAFLVAHVDGAQPQDTFEVLIDNQFAASVTGTDAVTLALPSYRKYDVRMRSTGERILAYDSSPKTVSLYPGAVTGVEWRVAPISIQMGRLVTHSGQPVANAVLTSRGVWSETDADGFFQIEAPDNAELSVSLSDGTTFTTRLPYGTRGEGVVSLGEVTCCDRETTLVRAAAANSKPGKN